MAGLGGGERQRNGLEVAQLADRDDVGILAQRRLQGAGEAPRVAADLALVDDAAHRRVQVLDRIFDRDDVILALLVDQPEKGGERRRLAATGRAGEQHEPLVVVGELGERAGQAEARERRHFERDGAQHDAEAALMAVDVAAEARPAGDRPGEIDLAVAIEALAQAGLEELRDEALDRRAFERSVAGESEPPVAAQQNALAGEDVDVACLLRDRVLEDPVDPAAGAGRDLPGRGLLEVDGGDRRPGCDERRRDLRALLRDHLALHREELVELRPGHPSGVDPELAQRSRVGAARLGAGRFGELLGGEQLVVDRQVAEQVQVGAHRIESQSTEEGGRRRSPRGARAPAGRWR